MNWNKDQEIDNFTKERIEALQKHQDSIVKPVKFGQSNIHSRVSSNPDQSAGVVQEETDIAKNRVALMLDSSGSMSDLVQDNKSKMMLLKEAVINFVDSTNFSDTALAVYPFPMNEYDNQCCKPIPLTRIGKYIESAVDQYEPAGDTPINITMNAVLANEPITAGIIVSDGEADNPELAKTTARAYKEMDIKIDCVHIGSSDRGEELLKTIADITDGQYIKFKDVANFCKAFKYLSPAYAGLLTSMTTEERRKLLNANEVK